MKPNRINSSGRACPDRFCRAGSSCLIGPSYTTPHGAELQPPLQPRAAAAFGASPYSWRHAAPPPAASASNPEAVRETSRDSTTAWPPGRGERAPDRHATSAARTAPIPASVSPEKRPPAVRTRCSGHRQSRPPAPAPLRTLPPGSGCSSHTVTCQPASARTFAATSPFGPAPIPTASGAPELSRSAMTIRYPRHVPSIRMTPERGHGSRPPTISATMRMAIGG